MSKYFDGKELTTFLAPEVKENGRHMVMTNVQTEAKTKFVNIDTRFQEEYNMQNFADITFKLPQQIINVKSIKITNIEVPASFYPFSLRRRNTFFKIVDTSTNIFHVIKIYDGFYTQTNLIQTIASLLSSAGLSSDIVFGIHTNYGAGIEGDKHKVEFYNQSATTNYAIYFNVDEYGNQDKYSLKSKLGWCMGFREALYDLSHGCEVVSEGIFNMNPFQYLFISVDDFHPNNPNSFIAPSTLSYMNSNILGRVSLAPSAYPIGGSIVASHMTGLLLTDVRKYEGKTDIQKLRIQILDEFGVVVDLNKMDFAFVLEIVYM